jgi:uncharacterized protein (TIGR02453 family)
MVTNPNPPEFKKIASFLKALQENNNKPYMDLQREVYQELRLQWKAYTTELINEIHGFDPKSVAFCEVSQAMFRINRDVRFGNNKSPYNTHFSIQISQNGKKSKYAGYYTRVSCDGELWVGAGIFSPEATELRTLRKGLVEQASKFKKILKKITENDDNFYTSLMDNKLVRCPLEFKKESQNPFVYYKSFILLGKTELSQFKTDQEVLNFVKLKMENLKPFVRFLNDLLDCVD